MSNVVNRAGVRLLRRRTLFGLFMAGPALYKVLGLPYKVYGLVFRAREAMVQGLGRRL